MDKGKNFVKPWISFFMDPKNLITQYHARALLFLIIVYRQFSSWILLWVRFVWSVIRLKLNIFHFISVRRCKIKKKRVPVSLFRCKKMKIQEINKVTFLFSINYNAAQYLLNNIFSSVYSFPLVRFQKSKEILQQKTVVLSNNWKRARLYYTQYGYIANGERSEGRTQHVHNRTRKHS